MTDMIYRDRTEVGLALAHRLALYRNSGCLVLGLPNGGIPVGVEIAKGIGADFSLLFVSKITPRFNSEVGYGAVSETGVVRLDSEMAKRWGLRPDEIEEDIRIAKRKIEARKKSFMIAQGRPDLSRRTVILTDDGLAGGYTMMTAVEAVKSLNASAIVVAVPTAPRDTYSRISLLVDAIVCPDVRDGFPFAVADAYERWHDVSLEEAITILQKEGYMKR